VAKVITDGAIAAGPWGRSVVELGPVRPAVVHSNNRRGRDGGVQPSE
jgi:hypothetical protein